MDKEADFSDAKSEFFLQDKNEVDEEEEEEEERKILKKSMRWSTRFKCYAAYSCCVMSYSVLQINCESLYEYGSIVLIPFVLFRILMAVPAVVIQILMGRYIMTDLSKSWSMNVLSKGVLFCEMASTSYTIVHSLTATAFVLKYLLLSFSMPWETCNKEWASISCYENLHFQKFFVKCLEEHTREFCENLNWKISGTDYWKYVTLNVKKPASVFYFVMCSLATCVGVFVLVIKGVQSAEKSFIFFMILPLAMMPVVMFIVCFIPEFTKGIMKALETDLKDLLNLEIWVKSYYPTLFALGVGRLPISFVSSRANFEDDIFSEVLIICLFDSLFCLLITVPTYYVIAIMQDYNIDKTLCSDALWFFISLSEMMTLLPYPKYALACFYYLYLFLISMGSLTISTLALVETTIGFAPHFLANFYITLSLSVLSFIGSVLFYIFNFDFVILCDELVASTLFLYLLNLEMIYGLQNFVDDFYFMMGFPVPFFLKFAWLLSLPTSLAMIVLDILVYHNCSASVITYISLGTPFVIYIFSASIQIGINYKKLRITKPFEVFHTDPDWGPADPLFKKSRALFDPRAVTKEFMYRQELQEKISLKPPDISEQSIVNTV